MNLFKLGMILVLLSLFAAVTRADDGKPVAGTDTRLRHLNVEISDKLREELLTQRWKGKNLLIELKSAAEVEKLAGADVGGKVAKEIDFEKQRIVFVMRMTNIGKFGHQVLKVDGKTYAIFYVEGATGKAQPDIATYGIDFYAVDRALVADVEQAERKR